MRIITISNQKGGVGKTTTAAAIGQAAVKNGLHVLCVDLDAQGSLTTICKADGTKPGSYEIFKGTDPAQLIQQIPNMPDVIPASLSLAGIDAELSSRPGRDFLLKSALDLLQGYDLIILDSPPTLSTILINALTAAHEVIIPLQADTFATQSLFQLSDTISQVKKFCNTQLKIAGVLITKYSGRTILSRDLREVISEKCSSLGIHVFNTVIREGISIREAQTLRENLFDYAANSKPAKDYLSLIEELEVI